MTLSSGLRSVSDALFPRIADGLRSMVFEYRLLKVRMLLSVAVATSFTVAATVMVRLIRFLYVATGAMLEPVLRNEMVFAFPDWVWMSITTFPKQIACAFESLPS